MLEHVSLTIWMLTAKLSQLRIFRSLSNYDFYIKGTNRKSIEGSN